MLSNAQGDLTLALSRETEGDFSGASSWAQPLFRRSEEPAL